MYCMCIILCECSIFVSYYKDLDVIASSMRWILPLKLVVLEIYLSNLQPFEIFSLLWNGAYSFIFLLNLHCTCKTLLQNREDLLKIVFWVEITIVTVLPLIAWWLAKYVKKWKFLMFSRLWHWRNWCEGTIPWIM